MSFPPQAHVTPQPPPAETQARNAALDGLRGFAALLVFVFHYGGGLLGHNPLILALGFVAQAGWLGLVLFFALSGFLITGVLLNSAGQPHLLRIFYARRALRILPLYFLALALTALGALLLHEGLASLRPLLLFTLFLQNIPGLVHLAQSGPRSLPTYHLWSLAVEEQFYLLWPMLLLGRTRRQAIALCLGVFCLCELFCCAAFLPHAFRAFATAECGEFLLTRAGALALGAAVALLLRGPERVHLRTAAPGIGTAAFALFCLVSLRCHNFALVYPLQYVVGLPAASIAAAALLVQLQPPANQLPTHDASRGWKNLFAHPSLTALGRISYGLYVFHVLLMPLYDGIGKLISQAASGFLYQTVRLIAAFCLTLAVAAGSWTWLEAPILRHKRRFPLSSSGDPARE